MNRIRFFRRQAELSQINLGKAVGTYGVKIHRWEMEKTECPLEMRVKIASALGLDYKIVFPDSADPGPGYSKISMPKDSPSNSPLGRTGEPQGGK